MEIINLTVLADAKVNTSPFPYATFDHFLNPEFKAEIINEFPMIDQGGSFPVTSKDLKKGRFAQLIRELESDAMRDLVAKKLNMDLSSRPPLITLRGYSRERDGQIHTDTKSKLVTVLIYLNPEWTADSGKLRVLYDSQNLAPYAAEITPLFGNCLMFKVTDNCWHGYLPYDGIRRSIQLNYVLSSGVAKKQHWRHQVSAFIKKLIKK